MTRIKICGLTRASDIKSANRWMPDYIGFVLAPSRRQVTAEQASFLHAALDARIQAVGVFVNEPVSSVVKLCNAGVIDVVQLHGDEDEEYISSLKGWISCPVIKAVRVQNPEQILQAEKLSCDLLLLDTFQPGQYGGSGKTFDYSQIPPLQKRFFLAGGLELGNIAQSIMTCLPYGIDPKYCDVIALRFEKFTGKKAQRLDSAEA